jgi:hypothetical protein
MAPTRQLVIRIKKGADGRTALSCNRPDGTTTWQRLEGARAAFFPGHDLTHFAVETTLGYEKGFFGLVAGGWDLSDFGSPWPRGPLPAEANLAEMVVGFFDRERQSGDIGSATELNQIISEYCAKTSLPTGEQLAEDDLWRVRRKRGELFAQWKSLPPGEALELTFVTAGA